MGLLSKLFGKKQEENKTCTKSKEGSKSQSKFYKTKLPPINHKRSIVNNIDDKIKRIKEKYIIINFFKK